MCGIHSLPVTHPSPCLSRVALAVYFFCFVPAAAAAAAAATAVVLPRPVVVVECRGAMAAPTSPHTRCSVCGGVWRGMAGKAPRHSSNGWWCRTNLRNETNNSCHFASSTRMSHASQSLTSRTLSSPPLDTRHRTQFFKTKNRNTPPLDTRHRTQFLKTLKPRVIRARVCSASKEHTCHPRPRRCLFFWAPSAGPRRLAPSGGTSVLCWLMTRRWACPPNPLRLNPCERRTCCATVSLPQPG